jgi:hypothetical protein
MNAGPDTNRSSLHSVNPKKECPSGVAYWLRLFCFMEKENDNSGTERGREVVDIQAVADDTNKRMGEAVEAAFLARVCKLRIPVCKPWGDSERYDFVVDWGKGFWRVQVKGGSYYERSKYQVGAGGKGKPFTKDDMDFVVVHIVPEDLWYVVPIEMAEGLAALWFNPRSTRARFEKYREAWCLLDCPRTGRGRRDIPGRCRSEGVKVRCAVCPLHGRATAEIEIPRRRK